MPQFPFLHRPFRTLFRDTIRSDFSDSTFVLDFSGVHKTLASSSKKIWWHGVLKNIPFFLNTSYILQGIRKVQNSGHPFPFLLKPVLPIVRNGIRTNKSGTFWDNTSRRTRDGNANGSRKDSVVTQNKIGGPNLGKRAVGTKPIDFTLSLPSGRWPKTSGCTTYGFSKFLDNAIPGNFTKIAPNRPVVGGINFGSNQTFHETSTSSMLCMRGRINGTNEKPTHPNEQTLRVPKIEPMSKPLGDFLSDQNSNPAFIELIVLGIGDVTTWPSRSRKSQERYRQTKFPEITKYQEFQQVWGQQTHRWLLENLRTRPLSPNPDASSTSDSPSGRLYLRKFGLMQRLLFWPWHSDQTTNFTSFLLATCVPPKNRTIRLWIDLKGFINLVHG